MRRVTKEEATVLERLGFTIVYAVEDSDKLPKAPRFSAGNGDARSNPMSRTAILTIANVNAYPFREGSMTERLAKEACEYILNNARGDKKGGIPRDELSKHLAKKAGKEYVPSDISGYITIYIQRGVLKRAAHG